MTCDYCQELISQFLDNELDEKTSLDVQTHLALCLPCAKVCEDFAMILDFCALDETDGFVPPNSKALWCRINNIIENEVEPIVHSPAQQTMEESGKRFWGKARGSGWRFSFSQVFTAVLGIAVISSLLTVVGFKNYASPPTNFASNASSVSPPTIFERALGKVGLIDTPEQTRERRVREQQSAIAYWNTRVQARRINWDKQLRQAFDRNLNEINQAVFEYDRILQENPQDELSGEMLDTTLTEKMELLREFSDL